MTAREVFLQAFVDYIESSIDDECWHTFAFIFKIKRLDNGDVEITQMDEVLTNAKLPDGTLSYQS